MDTQAKKQISVLASSTVAFTICFAVWMMFAVIGIPIKASLGLNETEFGILIATSAHGIIDPSAARDVDG